MTQNSEAEKGTAGKLKYRNRKGSMETGGTEGESGRDERNGRAPRNPLRGRNGKQGREEAEAE